MRRSSTAAFTRATTSTSSSFSASSRAFAAAISFSTISSNCCATKTPWHWSWNSSANRSRKQWRSSSAQPLASVTPSQRAALRLWKTQLVWHFSQSVRYLGWPVGTVGMHPVKPTWCLNQSSTATSAAVSGPSNSDADASSDADADAAGSSSAVSAADSVPAAHPAWHDSSSEPYCAEHAYGAGLCASPNRTACAGTSSQVWQVT